MSSDHIENLDELKQLLSVDDFETCSYEALRSKTQQLVSKDPEFLARCEFTLAEYDEVGEFEFRKPLIDILIAMLPETEDAIHRCLTRSVDVLDSEVQFTLFCFLDNVPDLKVGSQSSNKILGFVEEYLMNVRTNRAGAAWMAGDLLGDHWDLEESFPILVQLSKKARFVAGRRGAVYGLKQAAGREEHRKDEVIKLLKDVAREDRSESVRISAENCLSLMKRRERKGSKNISTTDH